MSDKLDVALLMGGDTDGDDSDHEYNADEVSCSQNRSHVLRQDLPLRCSPPLVLSRKIIRSSQESENSEDPAGGEVSRSVPDPRCKFGQLLIRRTEKLSQPSVQPRLRTENSHCSSRRCPSETFQTIPTQIIAGGFQPKRGRRELRVSTVTSTITS